MFTRRTGKVLAITRAILAVVFLLALWIDPVQPVRAVAGGYILLSAYLIWSASLVVVAWESWWHEFRLARVVHAIDILGFIAAVYFTETGNGDFASPFMAFAAFLLITATLRWGWTGVAYTALALVILNSAFGGWMLAMHLELDIYRFGRRQTYMVVLSIMMVWLSAEQGRTRTVQLPEPSGIPGERRMRVIAGALAFARVSMRARGAAIALARDEEPWTEVMCDADGVVTHDRVGPGPLTDDLGADYRPMLFDMKHGRRLMTGAGDVPMARAGAFEIPLADQCGINEGILVSFSTANGRAQLLIWGIPDICFDDLGPTGALAREIGLAIDREEMASLAQTSAVSGIRNALARDLHDSVAQFLAGTLFRIEALRRWIREGNDPEGEINAIKEALRREQGQLRLMIERLRRGEEGDRRTDLVEELETLLDEVGNHWHIATSFHASARPFTVTIQLAHELRQLVREAVANAAKHGHCTRVDIALNRTDGMMRLVIGDNGQGFPAEGGQRPRSIGERVDALGGRLSICDNGPGARLDIELPTRIAA